MKLITLFALFFTQMSFAQINKSTLDSRHQAKIQSALYELCGVSGVITQLDVKEKRIPGDNGVRDMAYEVELEVKSKVDQYIFDTYFFTVYSRYSDSYDHAERTWGSYQVELVVSPDVSCK